MNRGRARGRLEGHGRNTARVESRRGESPLHLVASVRHRLRHADEKSTTWIRRARSVQPARLPWHDLPNRAGAPDPKHISTSFVERQNLTMRMSMRRFTRLTNALEESGEPRGGRALYFMYYNFGRVRQTLRVTRRWRRVSRITCGALETFSLLA